MVGAQVGPLDDSFSTLLVRVLPDLGAFYDPAVRRTQRCRLTLLGDHALKPAFLQKPASDIRVVGPIEVYFHLLGMPSQCWWSSRVGASSGESWRGVWGDHAPRVEFQE